VTRLHAAVESAAGAVPFGHMGWGFHDRAEFLTRAGEYIADGLRHHQLVAYVGEATTQRLRAEIDSMPQLTGLPGRDDIAVFSAADYYPFLPGTDILDADEAVRRYLATAEDAVARGYTGFRAVVDVTSVARTASQRDALAQLEFRVDQQMAILPFSALCAYNVAELGPAAAEAICLHPFVNARAVGFQVFADPVAAMSFVLTGELDAANRSAFAATIERIWPLSEADTLHVDATALTFIDHRSLMMFDDVARRHRQSVTLYTGAPVVSRLAELLELSAVRVVAASTREAGG
jgi:anti-anti-sigma regulatory factor